MAFKKRSESEKYNGDGTYIVKKSKRSNIIAFIGCVLIAFIVWMYVMTVEISDNTKTFSIKMDIKGEDELYNEKGYSVFGVSDVLIKVTVQGTKAEIQRYSEKDFKAYIDVSVADEVGMTAFNVSVENPSIALATISVDPPSATVYVDERIKKDINLIAELEEDSDINVSFEINKPTIEVIGPKTYVERISAAAVVIPKGEGYIGNTISTFSSVQFIDKNGMSIIGTTPYLSYDIKDIVVEIKNPEVAK